MLAPLALVRLLDGQRTHVPSPYLDLKVPGMQAGCEREQMKRTSPSLSILPKIQAAITPVTGKNLASAFIFSKRLQTPTLMEEFSYMCEERGTEHQILSIHLHLLSHFPSLKPLTFISLKSESG